MKEIDLCKIVVGHLESKGYDVYQEVQDGRSFIDIVAVKDGLFWAIEAKIKSATPAIEQAKARQSKCHYASIASNVLPNSSGIKYCREFGIGVLFVENGVVYERVKPRLNINGVGLVVHEGQKTAVPAGASGGYRWTLKKHNKSTKS